MKITEQLKKDEGVLIMGIVNVTPDSFSDGGKFIETDDAVDHALNLEREGADIIDIGGESTRPGAQKVGSDEELDRTIPVIEGIRKKSDIPISIDTYKSTVAASAIEAGADIVNDITALRFDSDLGKVVAKSRVPVILMHMQGNPQTMQEDPTYDDPVQDIIEFLRRRITAATDYGIPEENIIVDPGIGFGKTIDDNYEILRRLEKFSSLGRPLLLGTSRKSFIGATLDLPADERLEGTIASNAIGVIKGASILRVHDVREVYRATRVAIRCR